MKILADASLPDLHVAFPEPFELTFYHHNDEVAERLSGQEILLCRSTLKVTNTLTNVQALRFIATASSGSDHIDNDFLDTHNIQLLDAKGSNASAVADYVLACLAAAQLSGEVNGKKAGIIGLGAVGSEVARRLSALNYDIICYDPPKSLEDAEFYSCSLDDLLTCDLICIHANLHDNLPHPSRHLIDVPQLACLKENALIINASRGDIVSEQALLGLSTPIIYCTDVYSGEPGISEEIVAFSNICTPHIAGHSIEAKIAAVNMVSQKLHSCYQLPFPCYPQPSIDNVLPISNQNSWQKNVLAIYNPVSETFGLKQAVNKKEAFLRLRAAHQNRHDFSVYGLDLSRL